MFATLHAPVPSLNGTPFPFAPTHLQRRGHTPDARRCSVHLPCCLGGSPTLQSAEQNPKWPTSGQIGYITPVLWGPKRFKGETKSEAQHGHSAGTTHT